MLLSRNKQKKAQLIMKNDHKSVGFLFSQNICPYVLVIERGIKLTMGKTLQQSSFSSESVDSVKKELRTRSFVFLLWFIFKPQKLWILSPGFFVAVLTIGASCMLQPQIKTLKVRSHFENKAKSSRGSGSQFVFIPWNERSAPCAVYWPLIGCSPPILASDWPAAGHWRWCDWSLNKGARLYLCLWLFPWHMLNIAPTPGTIPGITLLPHVLLSLIWITILLHTAKAGNQEMKTNFPPR